MSIKRFSNPDKTFSMNAGASIATGGEISYSGGYTYHTFTVEAGNESSTFLPSKNGEVEVLVVAGGGQGGGQVGGGGGAGGLVYASSYSVIGGTPISVTVGRGGTTQFNYGARVVNGQNSPRNWNNQRGSNGNNSVFGNITAFGGGGGGAYAGDDVNSSSGGSGGGGGGSGTNAGASSTQTSNGGGIGYGFAGGAGISGAWAGGGGGGAGSVGANATANTGGVGGDGLQFFGSWYAAGGSGCSSPAPRPISVRNIGGFGGYTVSNPGRTLAQRSGDGMQATGSGGGGTRDNDRQGFFNTNNVDYVGYGGSGIVIVRYR